MATKVDVLIMGGGIIGTSLARELQLAGRQVVIVDRGSVGMGCSYGNAGWVTPCFAMPLPQPGMFWKSIGWLMNADSPLYIRPEPSWLLLRWMIWFLRAMNRRRMLESVHVLTDISKFSLEFYRELAKRHPGALGFDQKGLLMVSATEAGLKSALEEMSVMADQGVKGRALSGDEAVSMEPALKPILRGGVYFPDEAHIEPLATVQALAREFEQAGGQILTGTEVYDFAFNGGRIESVISTRGKFAPDLVVNALGSWSEPVGRSLGICVPVLGGKGYSLIVENIEKKPRHPIMIVERKLAVTPRADSVRLAGTLELVRRDDGITPRRVRSIISGAHEYMHVPSPEDMKVRELWRGLRPCTPDGVPMIGFSKRWSNLFHCVGHQMLGLQSAPGSARLAADLIEKRDPLTDARPFRPDRFE